VPPDLLPHCGHPPRLTCAPRRLSLQLKEPLLSHASLWSSLESVLEELIVKFRPLPEEELLSPIVALLERAEAQLGKNNDGEDAELSIWKTVWRIVAKFFRPSESGPGRRDERSKKTAQFKATYKESFEADFQVSSDVSPNSPPAEAKSPISLEGFVEKLQSWKTKLEVDISSKAFSMSLIDSSQSLAMFALGDPPDLWPGAADTRYVSREVNDRETPSESDAGTTPPSTSSSAAAARKAAIAAAEAAASSALREGVGGELGGGSACIEIPGQYMPNTSAWADAKPSPELHPKLMRFERSVNVLRRSDQLVRRMGMVGSDGRVYHFLVQAAVPYWTRTDERSAQTHHIVDKALRKGYFSARCKLSVQPHSVIPMAQRLRLVSEPNTRTSLDDVHRLACDLDGRDCAELSLRFNTELKEKLAELPADDLEHEERIKKENAVRLNVFNQISKEGVRESRILLNHLYDVLQGPELLFLFRRTFAQQWAANCLLQYAFSVAERTPSRVVFVACNGRVLAPEFRVTYSSQGFMESQPVPFRMTPNLDNLIGFPLADGRFVTSLSVVASTLREFKHDINPILRLLMRDDLVAFYTRSMPKSDNKTQEMEKQLSDRVLKNVAMISGRLGECTPTSPEVDDVKKHPIDKRVRELLEVARQPESLCMMQSNFQGWL